MRRSTLCFVGWGDHVHLERWAGYFAHQGHAVTVLSFSGRGNYPPGVRQITLRCARRGQRWLRLELRLLLALVRPDIVHVHWAHFAPPVRAVWTGPLVVTAWGSDVYRRDQFDDAQWQALAQCLARTDAITCDSDDLAAAIVAALGAPAQRVHVVQWGVDTDLFSAAGADLRAEFGLQGRRVVFSARNFTPLYNQEAVVDAFAALHAERPELFLLMKSYGGDADYQRRIEARIAARGIAHAVRIVDSVPYAEMPKLYRSADLTLSIPFSDATPMSMLEAMAAGSVCVVSDLPSLREWVVDGETGFLADPRDTGAVVAALRRALDAPAPAALRAKAREAVERRASQRAHMAAMQRHYDALLGARSGSGRVQAA